MMKLYAAKSACETSLDVTTLMVPINLILGGLECNISLPWEGLRQEPNFHPLDGEQNFVL